MLDEKSLKILEFPRVKEILAGFTQFSAARELALNLTPLYDHKVITRLLGEVAEARHLFSLEPGFSIGEAHDIRELTLLASRGKVLDPTSLILIQKTLGSARRMRGKFSRESRDYPLFWDIAQGITPLSDIEDEISRCISPAGEVLDSASEKLISIKQGLKETRQRLMNRLDTIIHRPDTEKSLQDELITEREGRFVIPVKAESRRDVRGIVHDVSNTGATVFVEPMETVELGNDMRELTVAERQEIERILVSLSASVGANEAEISRNVGLLASLELALAKGRYADRVRTIEPTILSPGGSGEKSISKAGILSLVKARHPLLWEKAVPISLEIGRDFSILVITGPNTGGKTVTLKTIGLLSLMAQSGMPVPVGEGTVLPIFDGVFADVGDEQSIEQTLSSFSWHMGNIVRIIKNATPQSLVLLDELGTSTDPDEGAALARAILLYFLSRGTTAVATTHFGELKAFAHTTPGIQNASLDFNPSTFAPTFHLTVGVPGGSNALAIAQRLGLSPEIVASARSMLSRGAEELESLISSMMAEKQKAAALSSELEKEKAQVESDKKSLDRKLKELAAIERSLIQDTRDRLVEKTAELQKEIRRLTTELKKARTLEELEEAKKSLSEVRRGLREEEWLAKARYSRTQQVESNAPDNIVPGDTVWLMDTGLRGIVTTVSGKGELEVQVGNSKIRVSPENVRKVDAVPRAIAPDISIVRTGRVTRVGLELDLRGKRADEVETELDRYLNAASLAGLRQARIIHGLATGTVRQIVRQILSTHPLIKSFRSGGRGEGGEGVTVVEL